MVGMSRCFCMSRAQLSVGSMGFGVCARYACCLAQRRWLCQSSCGMLVVPVTRSGGPNGHGLFNHAVVIWSMAGMVGGYGIASVLGNSSRNSNQIAVGKCQALPSTVLRCLSELGHLLFCVKSSGNPMSLSRCMGEMVVHSLSLYRVRYCGLYCHGGNCLWFVCHLSQVAWSTFACCGGGRPSSVGAWVVRQWKMPPCVSMFGVSQSLMWMDGWRCAAMGLYSLSYCSCFCHVSCQGVCVEKVFWISGQWIVFHQRRGLDTMFPSAASQTIGCDPHWSVMSSKWACTSSWGITFSIRVSNRKSGSSCRRDNSISTVCCNSDPSCPVIPGGASRIFEWSFAWWCGCWKYNHVGE